MPGLMTQDPNAAKTQGAPPPDQDQGGEGGPATAADEDAKRFQANVLNSIYNNKTLPTILERLKTDKDPIGALAQVASQVVMRVEDDAIQKGINPTLETVLIAGGVAITDLADLSEQGGGRTFNDDEIQSAFIRGVDLYRAARTQQGKLDKQQYMGVLQQLKADEASGALEENFPGMRDAVERMTTRNNSIGAELAKGSGKPSPGAGPQPEPSQDVETPAEDVQEGDVEEPGETRQAAPAKPAPESFKRKGQRKKRRG